MEREEPYSSVAARILSLKKRGRFEEAEREIRYGLQKNPNDPFLMTSLADLCLRQGRLVEGRILAEEVLTQNPRHSDALSVIGDFFLKQRFPLKALECYRQAYNCDPKPYFILKSARALKELKKFEEALQELDKVLVANPENLLFLKEKALVLNQVKKFGQALEVFEKIEDLSPADPFVKKEILRLRSRARPEDQVLKELRIIVGMDSKKGDAQAHGLLAEKLKGAGLIREAAVEYEKAAKLEPQNPFFLKQYGFCLYRMGSYNAAIQCLSEAFRKDPSDYYVWGTLEKSYEAQGNLKGWLDLLEETSRQHPEQKFLMGMMKKVRKRMGLEQFKDTQGKHQKAS
jgi:tetratricopeptide (TPR) repeat protein